MRFIIPRQISKIFIPVLQSENNFRSRSLPWGNFEIILRSYQKVLRIKIVKSSPSIEWNYHDSNCLLNFISLTDFFFLEPNDSYDESRYNHKSVIQSDVMNSICNGYCGRLCLGGNFTECGACPWGWMMNHSDYYLVQPDYYLAQPQICYPCENTFDSYDWLFIIFNFGMLYMLHAQAILRFSGLHSSKRI